MSEMDAMRARSQRVAAQTLERMRGISSRLNTEALDASVMLPVDSIIADPAIQVRIALNQGKVESYATALIAGAEFPPVDVFRDGSALYLADGFHRLAAYKAAGMREIPAIVRPGGYQAAYEHAESANLAHGLELTMADKRNIYFRRLARGYWDDSLESVRQIARAFGVNASTISRWRREFDARQMAAPEGEHGGAAEGVAFATLSEDYAKDQKALARKKGGRKPAQKRAPNTLQLRQRALKHLRLAAAAFAQLGEQDEGEYIEMRAAEWEAHWRLRAPGKD